MPEASAQLKMRATRHTIFDTLFLPENFGSTLNLHAFALPLGQYSGRRMKDVNDTNMLLCGMLESPCTFDVQAISVAVVDNQGHVPTTDSRWDGRLSLQINIKEILSHPMRDFDDAFLLDTIQFCKQPLRRTENGGIVCNRPLIPIPEAQKEKNIAHIHQLEYFGCRLSFTKKDERPTQVVIGLSGILYFPEW